MDSLVNQRLFTWPMMGDPIASVDVGLEALDEVVLPHRPCPMRYWLTAW